MRKSISKIAVTLLFALVVFTFVTNPSRYMSVFFDGLAVWAHNVLPSLFPFALISTLYSKIVHSGKFSLTKLLFKMPCDDVFLVSFLCGYPAGARAISQLSLDERSATALCSFCSTPSPIFVIATVGTLLGNNTAVLIICIAQVVAMVLNGLIYTANFDVKNIIRPTYSSSDNFTSTLTNSILAMLSVGGLIALFFMLSEMIQSILPSSISQHPAIFFTVGLLEMTSGILKICHHCDILVATVCVSSLLSFGGICVTMQCYAFVSQQKVKFANLIKMKCTQCAFATVVAFALSKILL